MITAHSSVFFVCFSSWRLLFFFAQGAFSQGRTRTTLRTLTPEAKKGEVQGSRDSWMYPYQRTPMGNPYISPK